MAIALVSCQEYNIGLTASAIKAKKGEVKAPEPVRTDSSLPAKTAVQAGGPSDRFSWNRQSRCDMALDRYNQQIQ